MKIYTRTVLDKDLNLVEADSFDHEGPIASCDPIDAIIAIAGGSLISGIAGADASRSAANTQADASRDASRVQMDMFNRMRTDLQPYMTAGSTSLGGLQNFMGMNPDGTFNPNAPGMHRFTQADLPNDPGYQFRLQQGQDAIMNQRSAMGGVNSGATLRELTNFSQGLASTEFNDAWRRFNFDNNTQFDRLFNMTTMGENAAAGVGTAGINTGANIGANIIGAGNAQAAGTVGQANAFSNGVSGAANMIPWWLMSSGAI